LIKKAKVNNVPLPKNFGPEFLVFEKGEGVIYMTLKEKNILILAQVLQ